MFIYHSSTDMYTPRKPCYIVKSNNSASEYIQRNGIFEKDLINWSIQFVNMSGTFIDVGAHLGSYTINLAMHCKQVYAFEAQRMTYYQLCGGIALNDLKNVIAYNYALGDTQAQMKLNIISDDGGGSSLMNPVKNNVIDTETVTMKCLDDFCIPDVQFIKIDVEGYELNVLKGAINTIKQWRPKIMFEAWADSWYQEHKDNLINFLKDLDYDVFPINNYNYMFLGNYVPHNPSLGLRPQ